MVSEITLEIDKEFLEGYRTYKVDEILKTDNESKFAYTLLADFIENSTYNLNRLFEEMQEDIGTLELVFDDYSVKRHYIPSASDGLLDDLFDID